MTHLPHRFVLFTNRTMSKNPLTVASAHKIVEPISISIPTEAIFSILWKYRIDAGQIRLAQFPLFVLFEVEI